MYHLIFCFDFEWKWQSIIYQIIFCIFAYFLCSVLERGWTVAILQHLSEALMIYRDRLLSPMLQRHAFMCNSPDYAQFIPIRKRLITETVQWRHKERDGVSKHHQRLHCLRNCWFRCIPKKKNQRSASLASVTGEFPVQKATSAENVYIWWHHHDSFGSLIFAHG